MLIMTDRLNLREFEFSDWKQIHLYSSDIDALKYMSWGPNTEEDTVRLVQNFITAQTESPRLRYAFAIVLKKNHSVIGGCELILQEHSQASIGYCLNRRYWGEGYATEAVFELCRFGFDELNLHRIFATCRPENVASYNILEKIGMKREGMFREHFYAKGKWQNSYLYSILTDEFHLETLSSQ
jgi:[ribosomal protein S5]-alanine N-acetyltransferase